MVTTAEAGIELFEGELGSLDQIQSLCETVHSSEQSQQEFTDLLQKQFKNTSPKVSLRLGIGLFIMGRYSEAINKLSGAVDCAEKYIFLGRSLSVLSTAGGQKADETAKAIENMEKSCDFGADKIMVALEKAAIYRNGSELEKAAVQLSNCPATGREETNAEYNYQLGRLREAEGFYQDAIENFRKAVELSPNHKKALFHLAYRCDLEGDEQAAIDYYKQLVSQEPVYITALINLAVLYEDINKFKKASWCIDRVLDAHPNHQRAVLFQKDIRSCLEMYHDEEKEKQKSRKTQILEIPIADFELSVRSRNCLRKKNIGTIGDLLNITEAELLSYKNFGETSLKEIKLILESKGLQLGMRKKQTESAKGGLAPEAEESAEGGEETELFAKEGKPIEDLQLSVRARKCLARLGITTLSELVDKTEPELLGVKNFGMTSLIEIKKALGKMGLSLRNLD